MGITETLKQHHGLRLTYYRRWLQWGAEEEALVVYEEGDHEIGNVVYTTLDEEYALNRLIY